MVIKDKEKNIYYCEACKLTYNNFKIASKCEKWCKKNKSCNLDIIKYALK